MAMQQHMVARQQMSQQLRMTPQLQQAIKLLQLSRMELISLVQQEMVENPVLEEVADNYEVESLRDQEQNVGEGKLLKSDPEEMVPSVKADERDMSNVDWENYIDSFSSPMPTSSYKGLSTEDLPGVEQTLSTSESLVDALLQQLREIDFDETQQYIALILIGNLNEQGYLKGQSVEEIALDVGVELEAVEIVLDVLQGFEPIGVFARDLQECLLIQLERLHPRDKLARKVVEEHIPNLERKSYGKIARALSVSQDQVLDAARVIAGLEPRPGREFEGDDARYITPDIYIKHMGGEYVVVLNEDGLPKLKISNYYKRELSRGKQPSSGDKKQDEAQDYIQDKLRGAKWLIRSIYQRQSTIMKVTESILKFQRDFFDHGVEHLKPLVLRDVADDIEMHESTVSRVTTNKYVHTPRGIFELKFFFNSSITKHDGEDLASEAVKAKIREIISNENPKKPFSDSKIVQILAKENIDIARRTVAKYREMMGILSSAKRKQLL